MKTAILALAGSTTGPSNSAIRYAPMANGSGVASWATGVGSPTPSAARNPIAVAGTFSSLRVRLPVALTSGQTWDFTLVKNGVDTALSCTVTSAGILASDLAHTVSVVAGDDVCIKSNPTGTPNAQTVLQVSLLFEGTTAGEGVLFSYCTTSAVAGFMCPGAATVSGTLESVATGVMPTGGSVSRIYVRLLAAPGTGNSRTYTLRKNGVDTAVTVTISGSSTTGNATVSPVSFVAGDLITFGATISGSPTTSTATIGTDWLPSTDGEGVAFGIWGGAISAAAARYGNVRGFSSAGEATESNVYNIIPADVHITNFRADISTAAGALKTRTFTLRKNGVDTAASVAISGLTDTSGSDADSIAMSGGDLTSIIATPTGTPAAVTYARTSCVLTVDASAPVIAFSPSDRAGQTFEGVRNTSSVSISGAYSGTPTVVQVRLVDGVGAQVAAWATASSATGGAYSHTFSGVPVGGPYYQEVRDNGGTATTSVADIYVGAILVIWGQSQCEKIHSDDLSGLTPSSGMQVRVLTYSNKTNVGTASTTITKLTPSTVGLAGITGSGLVALANQWHSDVGASVPLMIVTCAYQGTSIEYWISDRKGDYPGNTDVTTLWGTSPTTGFAWFMAAAAFYQATAIMMMQGTSDVTNYAIYGAYEDTLKGMFESLYAGQSPLFLVVPHQRSDDGNAVWNMRNVQYLKATSGGNWRLCCWLLDWQMDADGSPHQKDGSTGNIRGGTRLGRGIAKNIGNTALDISGPQILSCRFTDGTRSVIEITYDRAIETPAVATTALPGFVVSVDSGATFTSLNSAAHTAAITASDKIQLTKASGSWVQSTTRIDYLRGTPFASDAAVADFVTTEASMETSYLSKVITDTTSFDSGRGMPASPVMGAGFAVAEATPSPTSGMFFLF